MNLALVLPHGHQFALKSGLGLMKQPDIILNYALTIWQHQTSCWSQGDTRAPIVRILRNRTAEDAIRIDDLEVSASKSAAANRIEPDIPSSNSKLALMALLSVRQIVFRTNSLQYCVKIVSERVALTFLLSFWSGAWQVYSLGNFDAVHLRL